MKKIKKIMISVLPRTIRYRILRKYLSLEQALPAHWELGVANTFEDKLQAFKLLHDSYKKAGLIKGSQNQLRITKYHANPHTCILYLRIEGQIIATISIILDGPLGLPGEECFDLSHVRSKCNHLVEFSALAVSPEYQKQRGKVILPLMRYLTFVAFDLLNADGFIALTNKSASDFYRGLLLLDPIKTRIGQYSMVQDAKPAGFYINKEEFSKRLKKTYNQLPGKNNLYRYFCYPFPDNSIIKYQEVVYPNAEEFNYFFNDHSSVLNKISEDDFLAIEKMYPQSQFAIPLFQKRKKSNVTTIKRPLNREKRIWTYKYATIYHGEKSSSFCLLNYSKTGLSGYCRLNFSSKDELLIAVNIDHCKVAKIRAKAIWCNNNSIYGMKIIEFLDENWLELCRADELLGAS